MVKAINTPNYRQIAVMGDTHGDELWTTFTIEKLANAGITHILHVGDFGIWPTPRGAQYIKNVNNTLKEHGMVMIVTLGNHEDYGQVSQAVASTVDSNFKSVHGYDHVLIADRGQHWNWLGVEFCSLGGANSIDKSGRTPGINWWAEESITLGDVYRTAENGKADIMISHDCPAGVPFFDENGNEGHRAASNWPIEAVMYSQESRMMLRRAVDAVQPELLVHGHYHMYSDHTVELGDADGNGYTVRSVGLDKEHTEHNVIILDPVTKNFNLFDLRA